MPETLRRTIRLYELRPTAVYRIVVLSLIPIFVLWLLAMEGSTLTMSLGIRPTLDAFAIERLTVLSYMCLWTVIWIVYFSSGASPMWMQTKTLRRLLRESSEEWETHQWSDKEFYEQGHSYYEDMSARTLTAIAVLVGAALLCLAQIHAIALADAQTVTANADRWRDLIMVAATITGALSFCGFVLSLDLLDSIFISYRSAALGRRLQHRFFRLMTNRRYPALIALLTCSILLVALYEPYLACLVMAIYLVVGYKNWFPSFATGKRARIETISVNALQASLLLLPAVLLGSG
ncbi:MAG: hypothetical protein AAGC71_15565 [Pseudomonadota bacterium]